jgi:hypothetical protein
MSFAACWQYSHMQMYLHDGLTCDSDLCHIMFSNIMHCYTEANLVHHICELHGFNLPQYVEAVHVRKVSLFS